MPIQTFSGVIANQSTLLVNARELHERLQICTRFDIWIQRRISEYNFVENLDFIERSTLNNRGFFKTETKDYHLTLDMAKELCMLERSELSRQARRYFIEQEKEAKRLAEQNAKLLASIPPFLLSNPDQTAMLIGRAHQAFFLTYPETKDILRYREMGLTNPEIAKLLGLSKNTIERRLTKMFELGLTERRQAVNTQLSLGFMA